MAKGTAKSAAVIFKKTFLTGLSAGKTISTYIICNSRKSAMVLAKELRAEKVLETELTEELYKASMVKVVSFNKAVPFNFLEKYVA